MDIKHAFSVLRTRLGPDRACANHIGVTPQHYEAMRNGRVNIPQRTADYIILKASEVGPGQGDAPPVAQPANRAAEAIP